VLLPLTSHLASAHRCGCAQQNQQFAAATMRTTLMPTFSAQATLDAVSTTSADLRRTTGYLVADRTGHLLGKVECAMYGTAPDLPDALSVKSRPFTRHRLLVPADAVAEVDGASGVVSLSVNRRAIRRFL
jgi:hypothetical protein